MGAIMFAVFMALAFLMGYALSHYMDSNKIADIKSEAEVSRRAYIKDMKSLKNDYEATKSRLIRKNKDLRETLRVARDNIKALESRVKELNNSNFRMAVKIQKLEEENAGVNHA